jgi:hypothetical protein
MTASFARQQPKKKKKETPKKGAKQYTTYRR